MNRIDTTRACSRRRLLGALAVLIVVTAGQAFAQESGSWEMRVCSDPNSTPFAHEHDGGLELEVAAVLADELNADLTVDWWPQAGTMISQRLLEGECDMIMGVPDGAESLLTSVAYYRSPYVFIWRADRDLSVESLDDPVLAELSIGLQRTAMPPHNALVERGLVGNIEIQYEGTPYVRLEGGEYRAVGDRLGNIVTDVAEGRVDIGIAWGPVAGYFARRSSIDMVIEPVRPQVLQSGSSMFTAMTIGVRHGDVALRDRLNHAIANSWEEIRAVMERYEVPLMELPRPTVSLD